MTLTDTTDRAQTESIAFEFDLQHSPEKVWRALTDPVLLAEWLLPVIDLELEPGAAFTFKTQPIAVGMASCTAGSPTSKRTGSSATTGASATWLTVVTFTLTPTASGTRLSLVHSGFKPDQKQNFGGARYGWKMMGGKLDDLLGRIP